MTNHRHGDQSGGVMDIREVLRELVDALDGAFISTWQSTAAWEKQLDRAREALDACGSSVNDKTVCGSQNAIREQQALASLPAEAQGDGAVSPEDRIQQLGRVLAEAVRLLNIALEEKDRIRAAPPAVKVSSMKLLGYANPSRIRMTCASKPGGAHLGQVAIYAGESVDPMGIQEQESPTWMGEPLSAAPAVSAQKGEG